MIHAIVADARTVRVLEGAPGEVRLDLAQQPLGELQKRLQPALRAAAIKALRTSHG